MIKNIKKHQNVDVRLHFLASNARQGLLNYRHLKMTIQIQIPAEYDNTDTDTDINVGRDANHSANF